MFFINRHFLTNIVVHLKTDFLVTEDISLEHCKEVAKTKVVYERVQIMHNLQYGRSLVQILFSQEQRIGLPLKQFQKN